MAKNHTYFPLRPYVNHFSHRHPLRPIDQIKAKEELICSGCGLQVIGTTLMRTKSDCDFLLHKSCFKLNSVLQQKSHPDHSLKLLLTPHDSKAKFFICDACDDCGTGFDYHCFECKYDLHVGCAQLPKTIKHKDHEHQLTLYYSFLSIDDGIISCICAQCHREVQNRLWVYSCDKCEYGIHARCTIPEFTPLS